MVLCIVSTIFIIFECWHIFLALLNLYLRDPSLERKASFFLKVVLLLPWDLPFTTLGTFWVLTNWCRCQGWKCVSTLGERQILKKYFCGQTGILSAEEVVYFPWQIHCKTFLEPKESFWLREDTHEVTLIPKSWKVLETQKSYLKEKIKKS